VKALAAGVRAVVSKSGSLERLVTAIQGLLEPRCMRAYFQLRTSQSVMRHNTLSKLTNYSDHRMALNRQGRTLLVTQIAAAWKSFAQ
jgi:DNA-binding NarL/FixJ family response regulator